MYEKDFLSKNPWKVKQKYGLTFYEGSGSLHRSGINLRLDNSLELYYQILKPDFGYFVHIVKDFEGYLSKPKQFGISIARYIAKPYSKNLYSYGSPSINTAFFDDEEVLNKVLPVIKLKYSKHIDNLILTLEELLLIPNDLEEDPYYEGI